MCEAFQEKLWSHVVLAVCSQSDTVPLHLLCPQAYTDAAQAAARLGLEAAKRAMEMLQVS
jgi:hypothetical protein